MLKVFLVEDEVVVREGIKNNIDWAGHGYEFCGEASDGELAFSMIAKLRPDIVITDVRMPFMDGIALSRLIKKDMPWIEIMILTGYQEFEYAKEAVSIGVSEYLLKPIGGDELLKHVDAVADKIEEKRREDALREQYQKEMEEKVLKERKDFFGELVSGGRSAAELLELAEEHGIDLPALWYNLILVKSASAHHHSQESFSATLVHIEEEMNEALREDEVLIFDRNLEGKALLLKADAEEELRARTDACIEKLRRIYEAYSYITYFGGVGKPVNRLAELPECFETASRAFAHRYFSEESMFLDYQSIKRTGAQEQAQAFDLQLIDPGKLGRSRLEEFLRVGDEQETAWFVEEFVRGLGSPAFESLMFRQYVAMDTYFCVADFMDKLQPGSRERLEGIGAASEVLSDSASVMRYMTRILTEAVRLRDTTASGRYQDVVRQVERYVEEHYADGELSLNLIASHVNFSPNHLSSIFSQETGQTLVRYLTNYRMNRAKEMLRSTGKKSSEISQAVGYRDPHYFSYLFKKVTGVTPTQFRSGKTGAEDE